MRTIAIKNLKGGVGKTVSTISLAHILVEDYRKRVLVVDCDGQCNLTRFYLGQVPDAPTLAEVLTGAHEPCWQDNVLSVRPGLWLLNRYEGGWRWEPDLQCPDGKACRRGDTFLRHDAEGRYGNHMCGGLTCCLNCDEAKRSYDPCDRMCSKAKAARKESRDKDRA